MTTWSLLHEDTFNRANAELNGATMSDGVGAWTAASGNGVFSVSSNQLFSNAGSWSNVPVYDSVMSAVDKQAAEVTVVDSTISAFGGGGPVTRWTGGGSPGTYYYVMRQTTTTLRLYRASGSFPGTQIGSWTQSTSPGDVIRLESDGSSHEVFVNGVSVGTATDSTYSTGVCGVWQAFSQRYDLFRCYIESVAGGSDFPFALYYGGLV